MNKQEIELNIELLKGNVDGFKALLTEQPDHPMGGSIKHQIDALEMAISALEKQLPKKIDRVGNKCPICKKKLKMYQRITGYLRCIDNFNVGKKAEFMDRVQLDGDDIED